MQTFSCTGKHIPSDDTTGLTAKGYVIDAIVVPKKSKDSSERFVVKAMDQGMVELKSTSSETLEHVATADLEAKWVVYKEEFFPYESGHGKLHEQFIRQSQKSMIASSMFGLSAASLKQSLRLLFRPAKSVIAGQDYKAGEIIIVPEAFSVMYGKTTELPSTASIVDTTFKLPPGQSYCLSPTTMNADPAKKALITPFWLVQTTSDGNKVNMERSKMTVNCNTKVELGQCKWPATFAQTSHEIVFEVLRNTKGIAVGEELLLAAPSESSQHSAKTARKG